MTAFSCSRFSELQAYSPIFDSMKAFTHTRNDATPDNIWFLEHLPVFTQGQAGKPEHVLNPGSIPIIQSDRGGQVTYHGPGQLMIYTLFDLKRLNKGLKYFIQGLENSVLQLLAKYKINAQTIEGRPGIYINDEKIASLGLRVRKGCTYHGLSLNVNMNLSPFTRINPCGFHQMQMTQIAHFDKTITINKVIDDLIPILEGNL